MMKFLRSDLVDDDWVLAKEIKSSIRRPRIDCHHLEGRGVLLGKDRGQDLFEVVHAIFGQQQYGKLNHYILAKGLTAHRVTKQPGYCRLLRCDRLADCC